MGYGDDIPAERWEKRDALPVEDMLLTEHRGEPRWAPWWVWLVIIAAGSGAVVILPIIAAIGR